MAKPDASRMKVQNSLPTPNVRSKPCPICSRPSVTAFHPFCSARCTDIDLHRWLGGAYALPITAVDDDESQAGLDDDGEPT